VICFAILDKSLDFSMKKKFKFLVEPQKLFVKSKNLENGTMMVVILKLKPKRLMGISKMTRLVIVLVMYVSGMKSIRLVQFTYWLSKFTMIKVSSPLESGTLRICMLYMVNLLIKLKQTWVLVMFAAAVCVNFARGFVIKSLKKQSMCSNRSNTPHKFTSILKRST